MSVVITMAGAGSRFSKVGYTVPKYRIRARGRTLFEWSMRSLAALHEQDFVFACLQGQDEDWILQQAHHCGLRQARVVSRAAMSLGQAQTALDVLDHVDPHENLWIYNIDTYIEAGIESTQLQGYQGCLHVFESNSPAMSYVRYDAGGEVVQVAEKVVISSWATAGIYGFESAQMFEQLYRATYAQPVQGEQYVAPLYQTLIDRGGRVHAPHLQLSAVHVLGTPEEVRAFDPEVHPPLGADR